MVIAIQKNLLSCIELLTQLTDDEYSNQSVPPYQASIGGHVRHVLDVFQCIFNGIDNHEIDLTQRERNLQTEQEVAVGIAYCNRVISELERFKNIDLNQMVYVIDDLGLGKVRQVYTIGAALMQAHSHAIHHFASMGYIISQLNLELPSKTFGVNPTTPKVVQE